MALRWIGICLLVCVTQAPKPPVYEYDVLVYSANAAGVAAAVTASASESPHFSVKVVEPLEMIGGMAAAGGVALMNQGGCGLTGLSKNWSMICGEYYFGKPTMMTPVNAPFPSMAVSEMAFWKLLRTQPGIDVTTNCWATQMHQAMASQEDTAPGCLNRVDFACSNGTEFSIQASYIIDASYDGDLMVMSGGIDYISGRESRSTYNESLAGVSLHDWTEESFDKQDLWIDPFFNNGTLLPYISAGPVGKAGSGDDKLMSFQYFACLSQTAGNRVPFYKPPNYNPDDFTLLLRELKGVVASGKFPKGPPLGYFGDVQCYAEIVENVTGNRDCLFCCGEGPVDADQPGLNQGWASANRTARLAMAADHKYYLQGSLYFMANDPRVPEGTRESAQSFGYCKDEYVKFNNFPPQLYVRASNRLQGMSLLTQNNIVNPQVKADGVAMGCWIFDSHTVSRHAVKDWRKNGTGKMVAMNEGFYRAALDTGLPCNHPDADCSERKTWYDVPYGVMVPKRGQASNMLIPVAISASKVAYDSARIENMFMDLGSAAGVAAAQLLRKQKVANLPLASCPQLAVQDADVSDIQSVLTNVYGQQIHGKHLEHRVSEAFV